MDALRNSWRRWLRSKPRPVKRFYRPRLEALEDRAIPALPGSLDALFGVGGMAYSQFGGLAQSYGVYRDLTTGGIYTVGFTTGPSGDDIAVVRHNPDGSLDLSFGSDGKVVSSIGTGDDVAFGVDGGVFNGSAGLPGDGQFRLVVVGSSNNGTTDQIAVLRYNADGSLDTSFGGDGSVTTGFGGTFASAGYRVVFDTQTGKTLVAGKTATATGSALALVRFNFDGSLDNTFGTGGRVSFAIDANDDAVGLATLPSGDIIVGGTTRGATGSDFFVAAFDSTGALKTSFGQSAGVTKINVGSVPSFDVASSLRVDDAGKILIAGTTGTGAAADFAVVRLTSAGQIDSFGVGGRAIVDVGGQGDRLSDIAIGPGNEIIAVGVANNSSGGRSTAVVRLNPAGQLDSSFGSAGVAVLPLSTSNSSTVDDARSVAVDAAGKIFVAGSTTYNGDGVFTTLSIHGGLPTSNSFIASADDFYSVVIGETLDILVSGQLGILANDLIDTNSTFTVVADTGTLNIVFRDDGSFVYTPPTTGSGSESFTYTITDGSGTTSSPATVTFFYGPGPNNAPVLSSTTIVVATQAEDAAAAETSVAALLPTSIYSDADAGALKGIAILAVDESNGFWEYSVDGGSSWNSFPTLGAGQAFHLAETSLLRFQPNADFFGSATIQYRAWDQTDSAASGVAFIETTGGTSSYSSGVATGTVTVTEVNDPPSGTDFLFLDSVFEDSGKNRLSLESLLTSFYVTGPANEADQSLSIRIVSGTVFGGKAVVDGTDVLFTPNPDYFGSAGFQFEVVDNGTTAGASDPQTFLVSAILFVIPVNDPPVARSDFLSPIAEDSGPRLINIADLLENDSPGAGEFQSLLFIGVANAIGGTARVIGDQIEFTPSRDYNGVAGFSYTIEETFFDDEGEGSEGIQSLESQTRGLRATGFVRFVITEVNDAPVIDNVVLPTFDAGSGSRFISFAALFQNARTGPANEANQSLAVRSFNVVGGQIALTADGVVFTPDPNFNGEASISFVAIDNGTTNGQADPKAAAGIVSFEVSGAAVPPAGTTPGVLIDNLNPAFRGLILLLLGGGGNGAPIDETVDQPTTNNELAEFEKSIRVVAPPSPTEALAYARAWGTVDSRVAAVAQMIQQGPNQSSTAPTLGVVDGFSGQPQGAGRNPLMQIVASQLEGEDNVWIIEGLLGSTPAPDPDVRPAGLPAAPNPPAPQQQSRNDDSLGRYGLGLLMFLGLVANLAFAPILGVDPPRRAQPRQRRDF